MNLLANFVLSPVNYLFKNIPRDAINFIRIMASENMIKTLNSHLQLIKIGTRDDGNGTGSIKLSIEFLCNKSMENVAVKMSTQRERMGRKSRFFNGS